MARTTTPLLGRGVAAIGDVGGNSATTVSGVTGSMGTATISEESGRASTAATDAASAAVSGAASATESRAAAAALAGVRCPLPRPPRRRRRRTGRAPDSLAAARDSGSISPCASISGRASGSGSGVGGVAITGAAFSPTSASKYFGCNGSGAFACSAESLPRFGRRLIRSFIHLRIQRL